MPRPTPHRPASLQWERSSLHCCEHHLSGRRKSSKIRWSAGGRAEGLRYRRPTTIGTSVSDIGHFGVRGRSTITPALPQGVRIHQDGDRVEAGPPSSKGSDRSLAMSRRGRCRLRHTVVVGARDHAYFAGRAYVFTKTTTRVESRPPELESSDTVADGFGGVSGRLGYDRCCWAIYHSNEAGRAYVFTKTATGWKQVAELKGSDTEAGRRFRLLGLAVAGTTVLVGAGGHANEAGRAYVFTKTVTGWKQTAELKGVDTVAGDWFGESVAISEQLGHRRRRQQRQRRRPGVRVHQRRQDGRRPPSSRAPTHSPATISGALWPSRHYRGCRG